jgi:hypothetical protein
MYARHYRILQKDNKKASSSQESQRGIDRRGRHKKDGVNSSKKLLLTSRKVKVKVIKVSHFRWSKKKY